MADVALADDLVQAVAVAIRDSYDDDPIRCNKPNLYAADWEARAAVATVLRALSEDLDERAKMATAHWEDALHAMDPKATAKRTEANVHGWTARRYRFLAEAVERGGQP